MVEETEEMEDILAGSRKSSIPTALFISFKSMLLVLISPYLNIIILKVMKTTMFGHLRWWTCCPKKILEKCGESKRDEPKNL